MRTLLTPVALEEKSYTVNVLHKVLDAFGLQASKKEVGRGYAGEDTVKQVRALQAKLNVRVDDSTLIDGVTLTAIEEAMERMGLTEASRSFNVTGTVKQRDGSVRKRLQLLAFDLDLRAVAAYRSVRDLKEMKKAGGFEFLGRTTSDSRGRYSMTFYDWQYTEAERGKADVVVFAIEREAIVGRSRLVNSEDYSEKGQVRDLDIFIAQEDESTEYDGLMRDLSAFLKESKTTLGEIAVSRDQLAFTASELDVGLAQVTVAAAGERLRGQNAGNLSHELLYGIGRQGIRLSWATLYRKHEEELRKALEVSADKRIVRRFDEEEVAAFFDLLKQLAATHVLSDQEAEGGNTLNAMLTHALPDEKKRLAFMRALDSFQGDDFREFWNKHLPADKELGDDPQMVSRLLLTQQLTVLTGNHQPLVEELQVTRKLAAVSDLVDLEEEEWLEIVKTTGVPDFIRGKNDEEKSAAFVGMMTTMLNAAFPTRRIARMVKRNELPIKESSVLKGIGEFLTKNEKFDFAESRVFDYDEAIRKVAGEEFEAVKSELMRIQRVFQVSTSPKVMSKLMELELNAAYTIAGIPQKTFVKTYAPQLGGEAPAFEVHQRAAHVSTKSEMCAMKMMEYTHGVAPSTVIDKTEFAAIIKSVKNHVPNYSELFGSPDICECEDCRSVYSAAAYFVDLLRFLWRGDTNANGESPLDMLARRRPDLFFLPLTCENTNTIIPYIDLANEVMEYYVSHGSLATFKGYDTGDATAEELRANPQNFDIEAYRKIKDTKYPFTLPYHQPLDVIRTYSGQLGTSRYEVLKAANPVPDASTTRAIQAEALSLAQEEYRILTGEAFDGTSDTTQVHEYFGYAAPGDLEDLGKIREFLHRSGLAYTDLVELLKTQFINPYRDALDFLEKLFSCGSLDASTIYSRLVQIEAGTLDPATDPGISSILAGYEADTGLSITAAEFGQWVKDHLGEFRQVLTLYEPDSRCDLSNTRIRTLKSIYEGASTSGVTSGVWSKLHRFIRLWRKLGWSIHETDLMLAAIGADDIDPGTIAGLESVSLLYKKTRRPLNQLAVLWGSIDTYGKKALYRKLFLNKAVQKIDAAFEADAWGDYLQGAGEILGDHQSAILAAFRIREEDLEAILGVAQVADAGGPRLLDITTDRLNLQNLSTIYRYVALAKGLSLRVTDLCRLISLFGASPFSIWDLAQSEFADINPARTYEFSRLSASTKEAGFKSPVLEYILQGTLPADSTLGLDAGSSFQTARDIREAFGSIEQDHPESPESPLTSEMLSSKLSLTFQPETVIRFMGILDGTAVFETMTDTNLDVTISDDLAGKYAYVKGSGRLHCAGIMSEAERTALKGLTNASTGFNAAIDELYAAPEEFISDNFDGVFTDLAEAYASLLDHPAQSSAADLEEKMNFVYDLFLPLLKGKLRQDAITKHIAALIGLSEEATALLIAGDIDQLMTDLSSEGFSGEYFSDAGWTASALKRTDKAVDFSWGLNAPDASVPADNFSVRWRAYIASPASGEYTLVVDVEEADDAFNLYFDDLLILQKATGDPSTSLEVLVDLNAAQMHLLVLEYAETTQGAGIRLHWKTATTALEIVPAAHAYPGAILEAFADQATVFHRAAEFITGFDLSETELDHLIAYSADFGGIDFKAITASHWERVRDYVNLRNGVPQAQAMLTDVFSLASTPNPAPTVEEMTEMLRLATAWDGTCLDYIIGDHFGLAVGDFKNEIAIGRIREVMQIVAKTGLSAETVAAWGKAETDFDVLYETAQSIKNAVKAKYEEEDWLDVAGDLSDRIRENQKQALIIYLLMQPAIMARGVEDADGLFEYLLIDVQMGACMDTSRIVQANSSIQMFVSRCMLNLENDITGGSQKGVSSDALDKERWEYFKNYRVWQVSRKVFLYAENWLEPEWRNDRSEFFKEMESYLVQNDITERSVEQAFRNYLTRLNEVANLEVCGMCREDLEDGSLKYMHVFARTRNMPYKFFYRRWNELGKWSAWESVQVDVRSVEAGKDSGCHLVPVVWKKRLFLFWPEFLEVKEPSEYNRSQSATNLAKGSISSLEPDVHWEIRLAWSEYVEGKWTPKQVSKEYVKHIPMYDVVTEKDLLFTPSISSKQVLTIAVTGPGCLCARGWFRLADITSEVRTSSKINCVGDVEGDSVYAYSFSNRSTEARLELEDDVYLMNSTNHNLLPVDTMKGLNIRLETPFFFSDGERSYFVRPVDIVLNNWLKQPKGFNIFKMAIYDDSGFSIPMDIPEYGPDDHIPIEYMVPCIAGKNPAYYMGNSDLSQPMSLSFPGGGAIGAPIRQPAMMRSSSVTTKASSTSLLAATDFGMENMGLVKKAFGEFAAAVDVLLPMDKGLEFHTFYHPFAARFVTNLNRGGVPGLMKSDTTIASDNGDKFKDSYDPNFLQGFVRKPSDFNERTYYKENVCFDVYGANSIYNWELFFHAPLYIATRLSKNGRYEEAMKWFHYIFDPTTEAKVGAEGASRFWKVLPFKSTHAESLEDWFMRLAPSTNPNSPEDDTIKEWHDNPFDPHLVASNRPIAYMKSVVLKYVENLVDWADSLFRMDTMESVNEALQIYVIANHILGPYPEFVPKRGEISAESYDSLKGKWDDFSNALVQFENLFPFSSDVSVSSPSLGPTLLGIGSALYFCIPPNDKLLDHWDRVADRLHKIRHCQNIDGVERKLALFAPPIEPSALIAAASQGLSLGSILADLSSPPPIYRFTSLIQKANEFCSDVKALGSAFLAVLERKDAEELSRLRASHETNMLELVTAIRERKVLDERAGREHLVKARETAHLRFKHYLYLLGSDSVPDPGVPTIGATMTSDSQLPPDTQLPPLETGLEDELADTTEQGVKLIQRELDEIKFNDQASGMLGLKWFADSVAGMMGLIPQFDAEGTPLGVGAGAGFGGRELGWFAGSVANMIGTNCEISRMAATKAGKMASYIRRAQDWTFQANQAARQIIEIDKQITLADIRIQVAEKELENHEQQIKDAEEVEFFLKDKFTNQELYQWMKEQLFSVYKQSYNLAYDMAKKAEKAYKYELGLDTASFIQYGYWDNSNQGLASGEKLQLALRQLEKSYLEDNRRELELGRNISLALLDPRALIELRETGKCFVSVPEELFDLDFRGHYFRRIKAVRVSIPCVAGPYTAVNCSLRLLSNTTRVNTSMNSEGAYEHENDEGLWIDDDRFRTSNVPVTSIATSTGLNDAGMFEFNFRDERYLPFERAGAISEWQIELSTEEELRQFDYSTIADVIIHMNYTTRESGGTFKDSAVTYIREFLTNPDDLEDQPLVSMLNLKETYPTEWHAFLYPAIEGGEQILNFTVGKERLPFMVKDREVVVQKLELFARCSQTADYKAVLSTTDSDGDSHSSDEVSMPGNDSYGGLKKVTIGVAEANLNLDEIDITKPMSLRLKHGAASDYTGLATDPDEVGDVYLVVHYKLVALPS